MMKLPIISILFPVYNAEKYLHESIDSVLNQTFEDFEVIAVDDASTDKSFEILKSYQQKDKRIKIYRNDENIKLPLTLNKAYSLSSGKYIARMDADDIALPFRLERQYTFMLENPNVDIVGSWIQTIPTKEIIQYPCGNGEIRALLIFNNPIAHPTVFMKRVVLNDCGGYNPELIYAQDYELWSRLSGNKKIKFANIPEVLLKYRIHTDDRDDFLTRNVITKKIVFQIRKNLIESYGFYPDNQKLVIHDLICSNMPPNDIFQVYRYLRWLFLLSQLNCADRKSLRHLRKLCLHYAFWVLLTIKF